MISYGALGSSKVMMCEDHLRHSQGLPVDRPEKLLQSKRTFRPTLVLTDDLRVVVAESALGGFGMGVQLS